MQFITDNLEALTGVFAAVVALALLATGFFIGRAWMYRLSEAERENEAMRRDHEGMNKNGL